MIMFSGGDKTDDHVLWWRQDRRSCSLVETRQKWSCSLVETRQMIMFSGGDKTEMVMFSGGDKTDDHVLWWRQDR